MKVWSNYSTPEEILNNIRGMALDTIYEIVEVSDEDSKLELIKGVNRLLDTIELSFAIKEADADA